MASHLTQTSIPDAEAAGFSKLDSAATLAQPSKEAVELTEPSDEPTGNQAPANNAAGADNGNEKEEIKPNKMDKAKEDEEKEREHWEEERRKRPLKAEVTWFDFERFKNRYGDQEGFSIIEVLKGHSSIHQEVDREREVRKTKRLRNSRGGRKIHPLDTSEDAGWIQRIRIQSPVLLRLMSRLSGHGDHWPSDTPRVFFQPFRSFHHHLPQMKECMRLIEGRLAKAEARFPKQVDQSAVRPGASLASPTDAADQDGSSDDESDVEIFASKPLDPCDALSSDLYNHVALSHIQKYVEFADEYIEPRWKAAAGNLKRKFRFDELGMVFQDGDLLHAQPVPADSSGNKAEAEMTQRTWRFSGLVLSNIDNETPDDTVPPQNRNRWLDVAAYYIDWDGTSYLPVEHMFHIEVFSGERNITSFRIYPMRYAKDAQKIERTHLDQGAWFQQAIQVKHLYFEGWSFTHGPTGTTSPEAKPERSQHIEGEVIIDFAEGFKSEPSLGEAPSKEGIVGSSDDGWPHGTDQLTIRHWQWPSSSIESGRKQKIQPQLVGEVTERLQLNEYFDFSSKSKILKASPVCMAHEDGAPLRTMYENDEDIILLPSRVVAYSFRERRFFMLPVMNLRHIPRAETEAFEDLKIDSSHNFIVRSLVQNHFEKQAIQKGQPAVSLGHDIIRGKGTGLFLLLHGVPGVGKTATAEAVAQSNSKPLFAITCGDLGFSPKEVETALRDIFRLAHKWDCILLLDEADVFLSRREVGDLKRNALVSVFLRVLEYYSGILFLTTNRVGTLDEAFKSRIHISLYYPPLSLRQTLAIFRVNIGKIRKIEAEKQEIQHKSDQGSFSRPEPLVIKANSIMRFAEEHYEGNEHQRWNGRQIRNAFQIAYSLAHFQVPVEDKTNKEEDGKFPRVLRAGDQAPKPATKRVLDDAKFETVALTIEHFEKYLKSTTAGWDKDRARKEQTRDDDYGLNSGRDTGYRPPQLQQQRRSYQAPRSPYQDEQDYYWSQRQSGSNSARGSFRDDTPSQQWGRPNRAVGGGDPRTPLAKSPGMAQDQRRDGRGQRERGGRNADGQYLSPLSQDGSPGQRRRPATSGRGKGKQDGGLSEDELEDDGLDEDVADDYRSSQRHSRREGKRPQYDDEDDVDDGEYFDRR